MYLFKNIGHIWLEIISPYSNITFESSIKNGGSICFRDKWVDLNDPGSGVNMSRILAYIYNQCKKFDDHKDEISKMYYDYINSSEYKHFEINENTKRYLSKKIFKLEDKMDLGNSHDPNWKKHDELRMKYDSVCNIPQEPLVEEIQNTYHVEGTRDFVISLIQKFIDEDCNWQ